MKEHFDTKIGALRNLVKRRDEVREDINKKGWTIVKDESFVYQDFIWTKPAPINPNEPDGLHSSTQTDIKKWFVFLAITTDEMIKDLMNFKNVDAEAELEALLKEIPDEVNKISFNITGREKNY
jgi:hypothetical protein